MLKPREQELVRSYPAIAWTEPILVRLIGESLSGFGCRFCIALVGLRGADVWKLPRTREEFDEHMKEHSIA